MWDTENQKTFINEKPLSTPSRNLSKEQILQAWFLIQKESNSPGKHGWLFFLPIPRKNASFSSKFWFQLEE